MQMTIFTTPVIRTMAHWLSRFLLKVSGWKMKGQLPDAKKYVMIAAPHTTNWDFYYGLLMNLYFKNEVHWMGKKEIFRFPFGGIMKWFGGLPVDRSRSNKLVASVVEEFSKSESLVVVIPPEGSRSKTDSWKTGFYYIASGAGVPILLGFLDYTKKTAGYGPLFVTTNDMESDITEIKKFYKDIRGKYNTHCC